MASLASLCCGLVSLTVKKYFLMFRGYQLGLSLSLLPLVLSLGTTDKWCGSAFLTPFLQIFTYINEISPWAFPTLNRHIFFRFFFIRKMLITFVAFCCTHTSTSPYFCAQERGTGHSTAGEPSSVLSRGGLAPLPCWQHSSWCSPDYHHLLAARAHVQLGLHQDPQTLLCQAAFQLGGTQHVQVPWHCSSPTAGYLVQAV